MYHKVPIQKLSHNQILKLLRGERVRVKHGAHHHIHASAEQHKKIMSAHRKGAGTTIQFDPYQQSMHEHHALKHGHGHQTHAHHGHHAHAHHGHRTHGHVGHGEGEGFLGDMTKKGLKHIAPYVINGVADYAKEAVNGWGRKRKAGRRRGGALNPAGYGEGVHKHKGRRGCGIPHIGQPGNPFGISHGGVVTPLYATGEGVGEGEGIHRHKKHGRKGKGSIGKVLGSLAGEFLLPF